MSHPLIGHDYSEKSADESKKEYKKRRAVALGFALKNKGEGKKLKVQSSGHGDKQYFYEGGKLVRPALIKLKQKSSRAHSGSAAIKQRSNY